jgi:four helix bundle protein
MSKKTISRQYDSEDRTFAYTQKVIDFINKLSKNLANIKISKQLIRSAGSVGANYIEANESLSKKDFLMRIKICRKEAKESRYWLKLISCGDDLINARADLVQEATELMKIFGAILEKSK